MNTIKVTNIVTGQVTELTVNTSLAVGDHYRLISVDLTFEAVEVYEYYGIPCVRGVTLDGKCTTRSRIADTARAA